MLYRLLCVTGTDCVCETVGSAVPSGKRECKKCFVVSWDCKLVSSGWKKLYVEKIKKPTSFLSQCCVFWKFSTQWRTKSTSATDGWWGCVDRANEGTSGAGKYTVHDGSLQWKSLYNTDFRALVTCRWNV